MNRYTQTYLSHLASKLAEDADSVNFGLNKMDAPKPIAPPKPVAIPKPTPYAVPKMPKNSPMVNEHDPIGNK